MLEFPLRHRCHINVCDWMLYFFNFGINIFILRISNHNTWSDSPLKNFVHMKYNFFFSVLTWTIILLRNKSQVKILCPGWRHCLILFSSPSSNAYCVTTPRYTWAKEMRVDLSGSWWRLVISRSSLKCLSAFPT